MKKRNLTFIGVGLAVFGVSYFIIRKLIKGRGQDVVTETDPTTGQVVTKTYKWVKDDFPLHVTKLDGNVYEGSRGARVTKLQQWLNANKLFMDKPTDTDGKFGTDTLRLLNKVTGKSQVGKDWYYKNVEPEAIAETIPGIEEFYKEAEEEARRIG